MNSELQAAMKSGEAVLARKNKLDATIRAMIHNELAPQVGKRLAAEAALAAAQAGEALGEAAPAEAAKARRHLDGIEGQIVETSRKLAALRTARNSLGVELVEQYNTITELLREHNRQLISEFEHEWTAACAAFGRALGRRQMLQKITGQTIPLDDPVPAPCEPGAISLPHERARDLKRAIGELTVAGRLAEPFVEQPPGPKFLPGAVYVLTHDHPGTGLPRGSVVIEPMFEPNELRRMVWHGEARPLDDPAYCSGLKAATAARQAMIDVERAEEEARREASHQRAAAERKELEEKLYPGRQQELESFRNRARRGTPAVMFPDNPERR